MAAREQNAESGELESKPLVQVAEPPLGISLRRGHLTGVAEFL